MSEIRIDTSRGITLAADFVVPVDSSKCAVVFAHSFLLDRHGLGWFDVFAKSYRSAGYATLQLDFSGCGDSADDVIRLENQIEDLKAACGWLAERGFERIILHADGSGALVALRAVPDKVQALVLTAPILGPAEISWEDVFSPSQLAELEKVGHTRIPNDQGASRAYFVIGRQTLGELTMVDTEKLLHDIALPTLFVVDPQTLASQWFAPLVDDPQSLLPPSCELLFLDNLSLYGELPANYRKAESAYPDAEKVDFLRDQVVAWVTRVAPAVRT
ncbi:alpha/beta hydrolase [uncultured Varibaculum sp.]|uniref:alpha/beta hydrolase n=1 Tax=uncultured Varibaculum sp. TaxID=413896 RepID=UPI0025970303|nr:alpha/beta hydrolase [uncultured Varibaculum sp.]